MFSRCRMGWDGVRAHVCFVHVTVDCCFLQWWETRVTNVTKVL